MPRAETIRRRATQARRYLQEAVERAQELRNIASCYALCVEQLAALMGRPAHRVRVWIELPVEHWPHGLDAPRTRQMDRLRILVEVAPLLANFDALREALLSERFTRELAWYDACRARDAEYRYGDPPLRTAWPPPKPSPAEIAAHWREQRTAHRPGWSGTRRERIADAGAGYRAERSAGDPWALARQLMGAP